MNKLKLILWLLLCAAGLWPSRYAAYGQTVKGNTVVYTYEEHSRLTAEVLDLRDKDKSHKELILLYDRQGADLRAVKDQLNASRDQISHLQECHRWLFCKCRREARKAQRALRQKKPPG